MGLLHDLRYALRTLRKNPGFTAAVILCLALGIGVNSAIFTVVDAVILSPLPYEEPGRLVMLWDRNPDSGIDRVSVSYANFRDWVEQNHVFEGIAAYQYWPYNLAGGEEPERVWGLRVSSRLFTLLGVSAALGRTPLAEEDRPGAEPVVVISHDLWQRQLGGDPGVIGESVQLDGEVFTVIGVMPADFEFPQTISLGQTTLSFPVDLWVPIAPSAVGTGRGARTFMAVARLADAVSLEQARAEMAAISGRLASEHPDSNQGWSTYPVPLQEQVVGSIRPLLLILWGTVGFVLLIACMNIANLILVRASGRQRELGLRAALGASHGRIVRQLLTESMVLAVVGGLAGMVVGYGSTRLFHRFSPADLPRIHEVAVDARVFAFTLAVAVATGVVFGLLSSLKAAGRDLAERLKEGGARAAGKPGGRRALGALVAGEIFLSLVLLIGAGLMIRSFTNLLQVDPGFDGRGRLSLEILLPASLYTEDHQVRAFFGELLARVGELPGVRAVGAVSFLPLSGYDAKNRFTIDEAPTPPGEFRVAEHRVVSAGYFEAMGIPLLQGRSLGEWDNEEAPPVVVISESMARRYWPQGDAVGKRVSVADLGSLSRGGGAAGPVSRQIVGVVGDVRHAGLASPDEPTFYIPYRQDPWSLMALVVRTEGDPLDAVGAVRAEVQALDPHQPVSRVQSLEQAISGSLVQDRFSMLVLGGFAALAVVLAIVGVYGVMAYSVVRRRREIGLRMALGARGGEVLRLFLREAAVIVLVGVGLGLVAAFGVTRFLGSLLFEVSATDPATFAAVALGLSAVALAASYLPARRATRVDPMDTLRSE